MNDARTIHSFAKNRRERVEAALGTFHGRELADIRVFVVDELGELRPTPKGLCLRVEQLPDLRAAIDALIAANEERRAA